MTQLAAERFVDNSGENPVSGFLHHASASKLAIVLTHGAGGNCNAPLLVSLAGAFAAAGVNVLRCDLPFRQLRPKGPPSPSSAKRDQEGLRRAVTLMRERFASQVYLGGQSYGGRQASLLAASQPGLVEGLLLLSYPLHPPGRPAQLRTAHLPNLRMPTLFIHGTTDPFASSEELQAAVQIIPALAKVVEVTGAGHSLSTKRNVHELASTIVNEFQALFIPQ